jgi:hypothetical protein
MTPRAITDPVLTFTVTSMERAERPAAHSLVFGRDVLPARAGWDARVDVLADGKVIGTQHFDRLDGEADWHCSASFRAGCSMPAFMHGLFSRCTAPKVARDDLAAILDEAAAAGSQVPA